MLINKSIGAHIRSVVEGKVGLSSATSLAWTSVVGFGIAIYNGSNWELVTPSTAPELANTASDLDSNALAVDSVYDIFAAYDTDTSFDLVAKEWTSPTVMGYTRYQHDGVLVHENSASGLKRRFLGTIYTYSNSGTVNFKDEFLYRYISNYYNKTRKVLKGIESGTTWTYNSDTWRAMNNSTNTKVQFVLCVDDMPVLLEAKHNSVVPNASSNAETGIGIDSSSSPYSGTILMSSGYGTTNYLAVPAKLYTDDLSPGYHYATALERANPTGYTVSFFSYSKGYCWAEVWM